MVDCPRNLEKLLWWTIDQLHLKKKFFFSLLPVTEGRRVSVGGPSVYRIQVYGSEGTVPEWSAENNRRLGNGGNSLLVISTPFCENVCEFYDVKT